MGRRPPTTGCDSRRMGREFLTEWGGGRFARPLTLTCDRGPRYAPDHGRRTARFAAGRTHNEGRSLAAKTVPCDEIVKAGELVEARFARGAAPSGAARKVLALLIHQAAGDAWKPGPHSIRKRDLRGSHDSNDRLDKIFDELQRTLLRMESVAPDGRPADLVAPVMAYRIEHREDDDAARSFGGSSPTLPNGHAGQRLLRRLEPWHHPRI